MNHTDIKTSRRIRGKIDSCLTRIDSAIARDKDDSSCGKLSMDLTNAMTSYLSQLIEKAERRAVLDAALGLLADAIAVFESAPLAWVERRLLQMKQWQEGQTWHSSLPEMDEADYQWPGANTLAVAAEDAWLAIHNYQDAKKLGSLAASSMMGALEAIVEQRWGLRHLSEWNSAFTGREFVDRSILMKLGASCDAARFRAHQYQRSLDRIESHLAKR